jgi:hypothetical protein
VGCIGEGTREGKEAMKEYFQLEQCRRKTLNRYLDSWEKRKNVIRRKWRRYIIFVSK